MNKPDASVADARPSADPFDAKPGAAERTPTAPTPTSAPEPIHWGEGLASIVRRMAWD